MLIDWSKVPVERMREGIQRYVLRGIPPGHFLMSLLSNDLSAAVGRADAENLAVIDRWVVFLHCSLPGGCHGSPERVRTWITDGGLEGREEQFAQARAGLNR